MNIRRIVSAAILVTALCAPVHPRLAAADPVPEDPTVEVNVTPITIDIPMELLSPATVTTEGGSTAWLDTGDWLVPGERWAELDADLKLLQTDKTRIEAENESMKRSLLDVSPKWYWLAGAFVAGLSTKRGIDEVRSWF